MQILPMSFTQNLFCLGLLLNTSSTGQEIPRPQASLQLTLFSVYCAGLLVGPSLAEKPSFVPIILFLRMLLFAPLLMQYVKIAPKGAENAKGSYNNVLYTMAAGSLPLTAYRLSLVSHEGNSTSRVFRAVEETSAISTIAIDFLISSVSWVVWFSPIGGMQEQSATKKR